MRDKAAVDARILVEELTMRRHRVQTAKFETPRPLRPIVTSVIQFAFGTLFLIALVLIAHYVTDPQVLTFSFLFR